MVVFFFGADFAAGFDFGAGAGASAALTVAVVFDLVLGFATSTLASTLGCGALVGVTFRFFASVTSGAPMRMSAMAQRT